MRDCHYPQLSELEASIGVSMDPTKNSCKKRPAILRNQRLHSLLVTQGRFRNDAV